VLAYSTGSSTFVPLTDVLGSAIGLVNSSGGIGTKYTYEPFGVPTVSGPASNYPYLFAGMEYDSATGQGTGLYHTYARYCHPRLQRFLSEDPLQFGGAISICLPTPATTRSIGMTPWDWTSGAPVPTLLRGAPPPRTVCILGFLA